MTVSGKQKRESHNIRTTCSSSGSYQCETLTCALAHLQYFVFCRSLCGNFSFSMLCVFDFSFRKEQQQQKKKCLTQILWSATPMHTHAHILTAPNIRRTMNALAQTYDVYRNAIATYSHWLMWNRLLIFLHVFYEIIAVWLMLIEDLARLSN